MVDKQVIYETALDQWKFPFGDTNFRVDEAREQEFIVLRGQSEDKKFTQICKDTLGITLPGPLGVTENSAGRCLWISPDEYLAIMDKGKRAAFVSKAEKAFADMHAYVADNTGTYTYLHMEGKDLTHVLAKVSPYNFQDFPVHKVVGVQIGKATAVFFRPKDTESIDILVRFSFADYVWRFIQNAAQEYVR